METTPNLALPYILPAQAQKHVTHNEAIRALDALVQLSVLDRDLAVPPETPEEGARYIVPVEASGAWAGHAGAIAAFQDGAWAFHAAQAGWLAHVADEDVLLRHDGAAWGEAVPLNPVPVVGVNTSADETNRLAVASPATLFTHAGGDHRHAINKAAAGDTASVLFQTGYSGRAEFGTTGDDDWHVKVSADGSAWHEAIVAERTSGRVRFPNTPDIRERLTADRTYYLRPGGDDGHSGLADTDADAFRTLQGALDAVAQRIDAAGFDVRLKLAAGTYPDAFLLDKTIPNVARLTIDGNTATPGDVQLAFTSGYGAFIIDGTRLSLQGVAISNSGASGQGILIRNAGELTISGNLEWGACPNRAHLEATLGGRCLVSANYRISGSSPRHLQFEQNSLYTIAGRTITFVGTITFTQFVSANSGSICTFYTLSHTGTVTGSRYKVAANSVINAYGSGASYLPGSTAGSADTGGVYL